MPRKADPVRKLVDAAMALAAEHGWHALDLAAIAEKAGVTLADARGAIADKTDILRHFMAQIDAQVLATAAKDVSADDAPRDRLFDVVMMRYEHLQPYKPAMRRIAADLARDPAASLALAGPMLQSMEWTMTAARVAPDGPAGILKAKGLAAVYLSVMRTWRDDDDPGLARTMAALDRALRRGEGLLAAATVPLGLAGAVFRFASAFCTRRGATRPSEPAEPAG
jgi:AcrR family transcriptional regulator